MVKSNSVAGTAQWIDGGAEKWHATFTLPGPDGRYQDHFFSSMSDSRAANLRNRVRLSP